jgi:hypothetical protein
MTTAELDTAREAQRKGQIMIAAAKLIEQGIVRLAVLGPSDSADASLANELGIDEIDYHRSYSAVIDACAESGVAALVPIYTKDRQRIADNLDLWREAGHASIGNVHNPITGDITNLLIAEPK